jgi:hypothetical protein
MESTDYLCYVKEQWIHSVRMLSILPNLSNSYCCDVLRISWSPGELPDYAVTTDIYYVVERRCPPSKNWLEIASDVKETTYTMRDYRSEKDYMFRIRSGNEFGVSDPTTSTTLFAKLGLQRLYVRWLSVYE